MFRVGAEGTFIKTLLYSANFYNMA